MYRVSIIACGLYIGLSTVAASAQTGLSEAREIIDQYRADMAASPGERTPEQTTQMRTKLEEARGLLQQANAAESNDSDVLKDYAVVMQYLGDLDLAANALRRSAALQPENAASWLGLGQVLAELGEAHRDEARRALQKALALDPKGAVAVRAHTALCTLFLQMGLTDLARAECAKALELDPNDARAQLLNATFLVREGKMVEAVQVVEGLQAPPPALEPAVRDFQRARHTFPDIAENHLAYGKVLLWAGRIQESVLAIERAAELDPDNHVIQNFLGSLWGGMGNVNKARAAYGRSLELNPDQPRTREELDRLNAAEAGETPPADEPASAGVDKTPAATTAEEATPSISPRK